MGYRNCHDCNTIQATKYYNYNKSTYIITRLCQRYLYNYHIYNYEVIAKIIMYNHQDVVLWLNYLSNV